MERLVCKTFIGTTEEIEDRIAEWSPGRKVVSVQQWTHGTPGHWYKEVIVWYWENPRSGHEPG